MTLSHWIHRCCYYVVVTSLTNFALTLSNKCRYVRWLCRNDIVATPCRETSKWDVATTLFLKCRQTFPLQLLASTSQLHRQSDVGKWYCVKTLRDDVVTTLLGILGSKCRGRNCIISQITFFQNYFTTHRPSKEALLST